MRENLLNQIPDGQLALRFQAQGDKLAFGELYRRYFSKLFHYCYSIVGDAEEAADITQDAFAKAAEKIQSLKQPAYFSAWVFRIARNACIDLANKKRRHPHCHIPEEEDASQITAEQEGQEEALALETAIEQLTTLMALLSPQAREILNAKYLEDRSIQELSELLGLSESAVKMRLSRARQRMVKLYGRLKLAS
jgi:RNA polymerase sigma-70 factor, ECF subfamily